MIKNKKGALSQIITATILTPMIIFLFLNLTISQIHIYTRNNLNQIAQESVNDIAKLGTVTEELNSGYKAEIDKYNAYIKSYEITYTFSQFETATGKFEPKITLIDTIDNSLLNTINYDVPTKITVNISQTQISTLQKIQNIFLNSSTGNSSIKVEKSSVINNKINALIAPTDSTTPGVYSTLYDSKGTLIYEGSLINGKYDGFGTLYDANSKKIYTGIFSKGIYTNYGTQYLNDGTIQYQGTTINAVKNGYGFEQLSNGYKYTGNYKLGLKDGYGSITDKNNKSLYSGDWKDNKPIDGSVITGYTP